MKFRNTTNAHGPRVGRLDARVSLAMLTMSLAAPVVSAQTAPVVQAKVVPEAINMRAAGGVVTVVLSAASGDLSTCSLTNVGLGNATPLSVAPSGDRRTYVATFKKDDLVPLLAGFDATPVIVTGKLQCGTGSPTTMIAHGTARVLKSNPVVSRVKPLLTVEGQTFKDLNGNGRLDPYEDWRLPVATRVEDLLGRMTLAEKAGLMNIASYSEGTNNTEFILNRHLRYLILRAQPALDTLATNLNNAQAQAEGSRLGIPLVITSNPTHTLGGGNAVFEPGGGAGRYSVWPGTLGLAATNNLQLIRDFADLTRVEWRNVGIRRMYGMQVDLVTEPRWTRNRTTFTESPDYNAALVRQLVLGYQGPKVGPDSVAQTIKHFPGDGSVLRGLDPHNAAGQYSVYPTAGSLLNYQVKGFQAAVDAGVSSVMPYYNNPNNALSPAIQFPFDWWYSPTQQFEEVGGAYNTAILTKLLRGYMGFTGVINTDSGILNNTAWGVSSLSLPQRWAKAVQAGTNIVSDNNDPSGLVTAVNTGLLAEADLSHSVRKLLAEIYTLGLFENPYTNPTQALAIANSASVQLVADEAHRQSIVLLRNNRSVLPVQGQVALYVEVFASGTAAATQTASLKALLAAEPGVTVVDNPAQATRALVWVVPSTQELSDRINITLGTGTGVDVAKVQAIQAAVPTITVINMTNPWVINDLEPGAAAVVATFDVKAQALIDLVRGKFQPSGKLPVSIPANQAAVDNNASDTPGYLEAFDYSYRNAVNDAYRFGFGMSGF